MPLLPQTPRLSQSDAFLVPAAAAVVGFCTFALSAGLGIANPTAIDWVFIGDPETHFLGWHLFRRAPWTPQIGWNPILMWPIGTSIGLTDAIPLMAPIFKPLSSILPADFQYQGLWLLGSFVLHGVFAALLMRVVTPRKELQLLGACLIVMSPPMLYRYSHEALAAHWQILWALWLALRYRNAAPFIPWLLLALISAATHPYLSMMVGALLVAAHARDILQLPAMWWKPAVRLTAITACVAIVLWQCGYFVVSGSDLQGEKFGYYSMNLLSPFLPASVYAAADGPFKPRHEQYEGFAYLGAGLITLGVVAVVALLQRPSRPWRPDWRHQLPFGAALATLLALAIGPIVAIGPHVLFEYNPQWWGPLTLFRASGRMAWPIYYAGVVGVLAAVTRLRSGWPLFAMSVALLLQAWDVSGHYRVLRQMRNVTLGKPLQSRFWDAAPRHYQRLIVFPSRMCTAEETFDFRPFAVLAGREGLAINAGTAARRNLSQLDAYCRSLDAAINDGTMDRDALYVLRRDLMKGFEQRANGAAACFVIDAHAVCVHRDTIAKWHGEFDVMFTMLPSLDELVAFFRMLDDEYRGRLLRAPHGRSVATEERLTRLARYLWSRLGGCGPHAASQRAMAEAPQEPMGCGLPPARPVLPSRAETAAFYERFESASLSRSNGPASTTHVDVEGEAVWMQQYVGERLAGRDAGAARAVVLDAIRAIAESRP